LIYLYKTINCDARAVRVAVFVAFSETM